MKKHRKSNKEELHELIGKVVVAFGKLEHDLRTSAVSVLCPAIGYPDNLAICVRTRFAEMIDLYEFLILWALRNSTDREKLSPEQSAMFTEHLTTLKRQLANINERRNALVHSAYVETEQSEIDDDRGLITIGVVVEGIKPFLHKRAVTNEDVFHRPFEEIEQEAEFSH